MKRKYLLVRMPFFVVLLLLCNHLFAREVMRQNGIQQFVDFYYQKQQKTFERIPILKNTIADESVPGLKEYTTYTYNKEVFEYLFNKKKDYIIVPLIVNGQSIELRLVLRNIFANNIRFTTASKDVRDIVDNVVTAEDMGLHYYGYIIGQEHNSIAAISIFRDQVFGLISGDGLVNLSIHQLKGGPNNVHIGYSSTGLSDDILKRLGNTGCKVKSNDNDEVPMPTKIITPGTEPQGTVRPPIEGEEGEDDGDGGGEGDGNPQAIGGKCVQMFVEVCSDVYQRMNSDLTNTQNFTLALFAQSASIFFYEAISIKLVHVNIWTSGSPYVGLTDTEDQLDEFQNVWENTYVGHMAHLITVGNGTGGIAERTNSSGSFCRSRKNRMCVTQIGARTFNDDINPQANSGYNFAMPNYFRFIKVFTHETGHILGSHHTQACIWNGNYTAIDGCAPTEVVNILAGGCPQPPVPGTNGGTIMSYCDQLGQPGIDFRLGFGPQPGAAVRSLVISANCLDDCEENCPYSFSLYNNSQPWNLVFPLYRASRFVYSTKNYTLASGQSLEYDAGGYIDLDPGFEVSTTGGTFLAHIGGCDQFIFFTENINGWDGRIESNNTSVATNTLYTDFISIYPNPAYDVFTIASTEKAMGTIQINIKDINGRLMYQKVIQGTGKALSYPIDAARWVSGIYMVDITINNNRTVKRLVKM